MRIAVIRVLNKETLQMKKIILAAALVLSALTLSAQPPVPKSVVFAGETVRFDREDLYERMDRELITFCYMHTTSTLMLKRSERVFREIEPILKEMGIPDDLKYLMVIESNLDPSSVSKAGAAGFWQLMPTAAREYGLEVNANVDERYNTAKATIAACKYLKEAYRKYGNWMTAAASYNAGMGAVSQRLEQQHQSSAMDLWLKSETSRYMFRILVAKMFLEDPKSFGFDEVEKYPYRAPVKIIEVTDPIANLVTFAEMNGVSYLELKRANLWLREDKLNNSSHRTYKIIIPQH